jgi:hypothetical protein
VLPRQQLLAGDEQFGELPLLGGFGVKIVDPVSSFGPGLPRVLNPKVYLPLVGKQEFAAVYDGRGVFKGGSFDEDMLAKDLDGPLDALDGLGAEETDTLRGWEARFEEKYDAVRRLVSKDDFEAESKQA